VPHLTRMPSVPKTCLNAAIHRIAVTQIRLDGLGQAYYRKEEGRRHVHRRGPALPKRRLARVVLGHLNIDQTIAATCIAAAA
jgi:transposase